MQKRLERGSGILFPIFSLPSRYGIGCLDESAYRFVDFLEKAGQKYWQMLPLTPTAYADSPYQSTCAFAGNPYYIPLTSEVREEAERIFGEDILEVDYTKQYTHRLELLRRSYQGVSVEEIETYEVFCTENAFWLEDFSLFMTIKEQYPTAWTEWEDEALRRHEIPALLDFYQTHRAEVDFWKYTQFVFYREWELLKTYANKKGIRIIGDLPIYVSLDSSDVWANRALFHLNAYGYPIEVSGVPPDVFSENGQLWGNPLYDWQEHEKDGFAWWKQRIAHSARMFDGIRIDHFIGIVHYYAVPYGAGTAKKGRWCMGPGEKWMRAMQDAVGEAFFLAEDLGYVTEEVERLLECTGIPGMHILQFGFHDPQHSKELPCYYRRNSVVYGGTHDNQTLFGYVLSASPKERRFLAEYFNTGTEQPHVLAQALLRAGLSSVADTAIFLLQDHLGMEDSYRINTPSVTEGNWRIRISEEYLTDDVAETIRRLCALYHR